MQPSPPTHPSRFPWWLLAALLLAAFLGAINLAQGMFWWDELLSLKNAGIAHFEALDLPGIWHYVSNHDTSNMPGYYFVLNTWSRLVGTSEVALRALPWLLGLLSIAVVARLGRELGGGRVGVLLGVLLASSAFYMNYLHENRTYSLLLLLTSASLLFYWRLKRGRPHPWLHALGLMLSMAAAAYSHYSGLFLLLPLGLYHLLFYADRPGRKSADGAPFWTQPRWWLITAAMAGSAALYLPWVSVLLRTVGTMTTASGPQNFLLPLGRAFGYLGYALSNGIGVFVLLALLAFRSPHKPALRFALFMLAGTILVGILGNIAVPYLTHIRYWLVLLPLFLVLLALAIHVLPRWAAGGALALWLATGTLFSLVPTFNDTLFREVYLDVFRPHYPLPAMIDEIEAQAQTDDYVLFHTNHFPWALSGAFDYLLYQLPLDYAMFHWLDTSLDTEPLLASTLGDAQRVWVAVDQSTEPLPEFSRFYEALNRQYHACDTVWEQSPLRLERYASHPLCCLSTQDAGEAALYFQQPITVQQWDLAQEGDALRVVTTWDIGADVPPDTYSVALHLDNAAGELVTQADFPLPTPANRCQTTTLSLDGLPAGTYALYLIVYNWQTADRVPVGAAPDALDGTRWQLETLNIAPQ